tara:strand:+ start:981 stop:1211 length:231 start_codon:yes stop_codon:yes gene_type:complete
MIRYFIQLFFLLISIHFVGLGKLILILIVFLSLMDTALKTQNTAKFIITKERVGFFIFRLLLYAMPIWIYTFYPII